MYLSKNKLREVSLGYYWTPNMGFEKFCKSNKFPKADPNGKAWEMFNKIESRYLNLL